MTPQDRLRQYAKDHAMTHEQLASELGLARETVTRILNGTQPLSPHFIGSFFLAFGSEATEAIFGDGQPAELEAAA